MELVPNASGCGQLVAGALPSAAPLGTPSVATTWAVEGQDRKSGAGILFFAYGGKQLHHFLAETVTAAQSLRRHNPNLMIAVVSNNATVDRNLFLHHIQPRPDLLFEGSPCPYGPKSCRKDAMPRQWLTRLYYLAHSPFLLTWALDSNVMSCIPDGVSYFLDHAMKSDLWGFDIAHANQAQGISKPPLCSDCILVSLFLIEFSCTCTVYPHNWNIIFKWNIRTVNLLRDWLLLQLRRGVSADDQSTLHAAEQRARVAGGIRVGQMPTGVATAFYSPTSSFYPRITRVIEGPAYLIHSSPKLAVRFCKALNDKSTRRQLWMPDSQTIKTLSSVAQCREELKVTKCPYAGDGHQSLGSIVFEPKAMQPPKALKFTW